MARIVRSLPDVQRALNELFAFKDTFTSANWNLRKFKITNASPGTDPTDYATVGQLPAIPVTPSTPNIHYTIVWESGSVVTAGPRVIPVFRAGLGRTGLPIQVWLDATNLPTTGPLAINMEINDNPIFAADLVLNVGDSNPAVTSTFLNAGVKLGYLGSARPTITSVGGASLLSIGLIIQLDG